MVTKNRARRRAVRSVQVTVPAASAPQAFDSLVMQGICVACKHPFKDHFNREGRYVGCNPNASVGDEFAQAAVFVPPVIIPSSALNQLIQTRSGAIIVNAPTVPALSGVVPPVKFGRPADMYYPLIEKVDEGYGERFRAVLLRLMEHRDSGVTLRQLVTEVWMPYSTVQAQVNKGISLKMVERRQPAA